MDLGLVVMGLDDGFLCSDRGTKTNINGVYVSSTEDKNKCDRSGLLKQQRLSSTDNINQDDCRVFKVAKTCNNGDFSKEMLMHEINPFLISNQGQQMLSFSSPHHTQTWPYYQQTSCGFSRNPGINIGVRGAMTQSQWMELQHQGLIYKYIIANLPIPSYLLNPITKALHSAASSTFSALRPNTLGWCGGFHMGFSGTDPEPGRCRRTDGKKWRCSKDAVADQKYCERHMNRGRHRSRKPVEGRPGHSVSPATTTTTIAPVASSTSTSVAAGGGASKSFDLLPHDRYFQLNNYNLGSTHSLSTTPQINRNFLDTENVDKGYQHTINLSMLSSSSTLSMSMPMIASDFMSSTSSPTTNENLVSMSQEVEESQSRTNWIPILWDSNDGGPLGEVLNSTNNSTGDSKNTTMPLDLMKEGEYSSPQLSSSPTRVLHRGSFGSVSNSSAGE